MDINITGQIAANIAENLRSPWYNPLLNASAGIIGGIVTGGVTLLALRINSRNEMKRIQRNERKDAYINFMYYAHIMSGNLIKSEDLDGYAKSLSALYILGSPNIIAEINKVNLDPGHPEKLQKDIPILLAMMAKEIQGLI